MIIIFLIKMNSTSKNQDPQSSNLNPPDHEAPQNEQQKAKPESNNSSNPSSKKSPPPTNQSKTSQSSNKNPKSPQNVKSPANSNDSSSNSSTNKNFFSGPPTTNKTSISSTNELKLSLCSTTPIKTCSRMCTLMRKKCLCLLCLIRGSSKVMRRFSLLRLWRIRRLYMRLTRIR